jgi:hypothetical protein
VRRTPTALLCAVLAVGCGEVLEDPDAAGNGTIDASAGSFDSGTDNPPDAGGNGDPDARSEGCTTGECAIDEFCDFPDHQCGDGVLGTCRLRSDCTGSTGNPVCKCDGTIFSDECGAYEGGVDVTNNGSCGTPGGFFPCGYTYCLNDFSYCEVTKPGALGDYDTYRCVNLPEGCTTCSCMAGVACADTCTGSSGKLTLVCES